MRHFRVFAIEFFVFAAVGMSAAQTDQRQTAAPEGKPSGPVAAMPVPAEPRPGPQMEKLLRALEGTWSIKETLAPNATSPNGVTGEGSIVWRTGPGGFSVIEDYQSREGPHEVAGLGVFWWDEAAQGYRTIWCDSTNPGGCINFKNVVRWEGSQLVLSEDYEVNGKRFTFKEVFADISPASFTQTLYGGESGKELNVDQTIHATKVMRKSGEGSQDKNK
jgi:hypothetical protein